MQTIYCPTEDYLRFNADFYPDAIALIDHGREITYAQFHRDLGKTTRHLSRLGLRAGDAAAVACDDNYVHWLLLLGFEALGVITASFDRREGPACLPLLRHVALVLSDAELPFASELALLRITPDWINRILLAPDDTVARVEERPLSPGDPMRLTRTSGTTGGTKLMLKSRLANEVKIEQLLLYADCTRHSRCLFMLSSSAVNAVYVRATALLRIGGTSVFDNSLSPAAAIARYGLSSIHVMPLKLADILDSLPADFVKPPHLIIETTGAALNTELRQRVLRDLASGITNLYGTNEVDLIGYFDADGVAAVAPGVTVQVVDDELQPLPTGQTGRIRVRTRGMVGGYINDPAATASAFSDGWFYTGDAGVMEGPNRPRLLGRHDELINIGGLKLSPDELTAMLLRGGLLDGTALSEIGITSAENASGIEELCIAVVGKRDFDIEQILAAQLDRHLPSHLGRIRLLWVAALPRTASGKLNRRGLAELARNDPPQREAADAGANGDIPHSAT